SLHATVQAVSPRVSSPETPATTLGPNFAPGKHDVICARGKEAFMHAGNKSFRNMVEGFVSQYDSAPNKAQRSCLVTDIIEKVRSMGNGFVRMEKDGNWIEVGDTVAREKVGSLFRNALSNQYRSSTTSKKKHRTTTASKVEARLHDIMMSNQEIKSTTESMAAFAAKDDVSDEDVVANFTKNSLFMLDNLIKSNKSLVEKFQDVAMSAP
ncbi:MAG: hypothetical protein SGILL_010300, partial [Bacillariaceae sp.]